MKLVFRLPQGLYHQIHTDLSRAHPFAAERVGFLSCGAAALERGGLLLLADTYHPVEDSHYVDDPRAGATINADAIRTALQITHRQKVSMFHVHRHEHYGRPQFSTIDRRESARLIPDFFKVRNEMPHGVVVFSHDSARGLCWLPGQESPLPIDDFTVVGPQVPGLRAIA
jgi:hypothetical protein